MALEGLTPEAFLHAHDFRAHGSRAASNQMNYSLLLMLDVSVHTLPGHRHHDFHARKAPSPAAAGAAGTGGGGGHSQRARVPRA